jgi:hypothetical protein
MLLRQRSRLLQSKYRGGTACSALGTEADVESWVDFGMSRAFLVVRILVSRVTRKLFLLCLSLSV